MNMKVIATSVVLAATLFAMPTASARDRLGVDELIVGGLGPNDCSFSDTHVVGGPWSEDCTGVDENGCVGYWSARGTHDADLNHVETYRGGRVVCPSAITDLIKK